MAHLVVKFESDDAQAMQKLTSALCDAMSKKGGKYQGVDVTALSRMDEFKRLEDIEEAEDMEEVAEILGRPYL